MQRHDVTRIRALGGSKSHFMGKNWRFFLISLAVLLPLAPAEASPHRSLAPESAPVYVKPYASIPTGHYSVATLNKKIVRKENLNWVFVKDVRTGKMGWTPKDQLLTPLHFSTKARLLAKSPIFRFRTDRSPDRSLTPEEETTVRLVNVEGEWLEVTLENDTRAWVHNSYLIPIEKDPGYFFAKFNTHLREKPQTKSRFVLSVKGGQRLTPLQVNKEWVMVSVENKKGYLPLNNIVHRIHVANKVKTEEGLMAARPEMIHDKIFAVYVDPLWLGTGVNAITLYSQPNTNAVETAEISPWMSLQQQETIVQAWALSHLDNVGPVWWKMDQQNEQRALEWKELARASFHSIIHNPLFPNLRIGLSDTLYRSTDGQNWATVRGLMNPNPAFAYSREGILFIDDKISTDNGETLNAFVFWESVLNALRTENIGVAKNIKILNIYAMNRDPRQIIYDLDVGGSRPVRIQTPDRGKTWSVVR